jgi:hypothetical protein
MIKTQVQLPDELYYKAKAIADQREWSLAEVVRRGLEYMALTYPLRASANQWVLPMLKSGDFQPNIDQLDLKELAESDELRDEVV